MRAGKAVAREIAVPAAGPGSANVDAGGGKFDDLTVVKSKVQRIGLSALDHRDQRG